MPKIEAAFRKFCADLKNKENRFVSSVGYTKLGRFMGCCILGVFASSGSARFLSLEQIKGITKIDLMPCYGGHFSLKVHFRCLSHGDLLILGQWSK